MGIWRDLAQWVGPTENRGGSMTEWRGVVIHIAEGTYAGTISWQRNPISRISSHFIVAKDGRVAQMVDTDQTAWTQAAGNGRWLSIENEGYSGQALTALQLEANAQLIARGASIYRYPLQLAESPTEKGVGWHGMGGIAWGNHPNCPGEPIKKQRTDLVMRARQILSGDLSPVNPWEALMIPHRIRSGANDGSIYYVPGWVTPQGLLAAYGLDGTANERLAGFPMLQMAPGVTVAAGGAGVYDLSVGPWSLSKPPKPPAPSTATVDVAKLAAELAKLNPGLDPAKLAAELVKLGAGLPAESRGAIDYLARVAQAAGAVQP